MPLSVAQGGQSRAGPSGVSQLRAFGKPHAIHGPFPSTEVESGTPLLLSLMFVC
ncbi:MAG: hypothetical protein F2597_06550 [Actinobacteria bacterium]|nr:hypothetical protein [Actinomycetota bacterium]MSY26195.1 hypothetical protein [Actinomycetota bacterium]MSZ52370.1 hypothetical protein [Actinomycetota bacterium]MTB23961.1 hypothetical protein [Actinomycetota bacterium]